MKITATETIQTRNSLNLSQAAVAKATGIPRNIMSAFEQQKILLLDDMQVSLVDFFGSQGIELSADLEADNDPEFGADEFQTDSARPPQDNHPDFRIVDGYCVPSGMGQVLVEEKMAQIHDTEAQINSLLQEKVEAGGFFEDRPSNSSEAGHQLLLALHVKWACLVRQLHGHPTVMTICGSIQLGDFPATHRELLVQRMIERFGDDSPAEQT